MNDLGCPDQDEYGFFIGNSLMFSDMALKISAQEFDCLNFSRLPSVESIFSLPHEKLSLCRLIVISEVFAGSLLDQIVKLRKYCEYARIAIAYRDPEAAHRFMTLVKQQKEVGEIGFLPMGLDVDLWVTILRLLVLGNTYIPHELVGIEKGRDAPYVPATASSQTHPANILESLTEREREVLSSVSQGKQNKIIAADMKLSEHTIKLHLHNIISKLGVNNRTEAAICYLSSRAGLTDPEND